MISHELHNARARLLLAIENFERAMKKKPLDKGLAFRPLALVKLNNPAYSMCFNCAEDAVFIYLGDIAQMPGHGVFVGHRGGNDQYFNGKTFAGYHNESFTELTDEEA